MNARLDKKSKLVRTGIIVFITPLFFELAFFAALAGLVNAAEQEFDRRIESKQMIVAATSIVARLIDAQLMSMMFNAQDVPLLDVRFDEDVSKIESLLIDMKSRAGKDSARLASCDAIEKSVRASIARLRRVFTREIESDVQLGQFANDADARDKTYNAFTGTFTEIDKLIESEQRRQSSVSRQEKKYRVILSNTLIWGLGISALLTVMMATLFSYMITSRLKVVLANTKKLRNREPLSQPLAGDDEISRLDEVFHAAAGDMDSVDRQRARLVSLVKDELAVPLQKVQLALHNLALGVHGELSAKAESRLSLASRDTDRVMRLLDDLLSIEGMEGARFDLELEQVSARDLMSQSVDSVRDLAERASVRFEMSGKEYICIADRDRLIQVLINLLSNAVKFSPAGGAVQIGCSSHEDDGEIEFWVLDKGRGIPEASKEIIFEPFKQVDEADQTEKGGTGLGLPICKKIVEQHGGTIGVDTVSGGGSRFWFRIPKN